MEVVPVLDRGRPRQGHELEVSPELRVGLDRLRDLCEEACSPIRRLHIIWYVLQNAQLRTLEMQTRNL